MKNPREEKEKKSLFNRVRNAFGSRKEKEVKEIPQTERDPVAEAASLAAQKEQQQADQRTKDADDLVKHQAQNVRIKQMQDMIKDRATRDSGINAKRNIDFPVPSSVPQTLAHHVIQEGETLSDIAMKHYGHAMREYWMLIFEANKTIIGDNPAMIKPGTELSIPILPDNLKD